MFMLDPSSVPANIIVASNDPAIAAVDVKPIFASEENSALVD